MGIIATAKTKVICQGILTPQGLVHTEQAIAYGTNVVGGVAQGKGNQLVLGVPVFDTVKEAVSATHPDVTVIFAKPEQVLDEIKAAIEAEIKWIVCPVERVAVHEMLKIKSMLKKSKSRLLGPASTGLITASECKIGTMPAHLFLQGNVGLMSRSSSILYEAMQQLKNKGIGVSSCVSIGAYPILGTDYCDIFDKFQRDKKTDVVVLIGEVGGSFEVQFAEHYKNLKKKKPLVAYVAGQFVPPDTYMGNISAIVRREQETALYKKQALQDAGAIIVSSPATIGDTVFKQLALLGNKNE